MRKEPKVINLGARGMMIMVVCKVVGICYEKLNVGSTEKLIRFSILQPCPYQFHVPYTFCMSNSTLYGLSGTQSGMSNADLPSSFIALMSSHLINYTGLGIFGRSKAVGKAHWQSDLAYPIPAHFRSSKSRRTIQYETHKRQAELQ